MGHYAVVERLCEHNKLWFFVSVMVEGYLSRRRLGMEPAVTMALGRVFDSSRSYAMGRGWKLA